MIEAGTAGAQRAPGFQRGPILVVATSAAVLLGAGLLWREELRAVPPWYFGLAFLGLLTLTGALGRWRLGLPWSHVGQTVVAASAVAIAAIGARAVWQAARAAAVLDRAVTRVATAAGMAVLPVPSEVAVQGSTETTLFEP